MTINSTLRAKVIQLSKEGRGRNEIARLLTGQGLHISEGSVGNIIRAARDKDNSIDIQSPPPEPIKQADIGQAQLTPSPQQQQPNTYTSSTSIDMSSPSLSSVGLDINSNSKTRDGGASKPSLAEGEGKSVYSNTPATEEERLIYKRLEQERIQWSNFGPGWSRVQLQIQRDKDQRRHELFLIDQRKKKLSEWKRRLEQKENDLTIRENRILDSEPYLQLAKQLQEMKLGLEDTLPFLETVKEVAQMQNMDLKSAAIYVAQELRLNRQIGGIKKQLTLINMTTIKKQQALTVLTDLLNKGVTEAQIVQLVNFADEWNKYWHPTPLQHPGSNNGNFSMNDWIRLNMLKSTIANMLNRMGTGHIQ